jgi:phage terminase large subunit-like protein
LRGPTLHAAAADELAAWNFVKDEAGTNAWDNLQLATREVYDKEGLIHQPQILVTTTPKSTKEYIALNEMAENLRTKKKINARNLQNLLHSDKRATSDT